MDALVAAGQPDAVPYLALALLSTFTLKSNKGGWEKLVSSQDSDLIREAELWHAAVHMGEPGEDIEVRNDRIIAAGIFLKGVLTTQSRVREIELVIRKYPYLFYGDPALAERLGTIRSFSRTSKQLSRQVPANQPHRPLDSEALKPVIAGVFEKHGLQFTYSHTDGPHYYEDAAGRHYKLDRESCLVAAPPALIYAYPFETKGVKILKWATNALEVAEPVLSPFGKNGRDQEPLVVGPEPVESPAAEATEEFEAMRQLWERLAGNYTPLTQVCNF